MMELALRQNGESGVPTDTHVDAIFERLSEVIMNRAKSQIGVSGE